MNAREQRRVDELRRLEEENAKKTPEEREKDRRKKPVEFGSADDFMLQQAIAQLNGKPVQRSKSRLEASQAAGKPDTDADKGEGQAGRRQGPGEARRQAGCSGKPASQPPASAPMGEPLGTPTGKASLTARAQAWLRTTARGAHPTGRRCLQRAVS